MTPAEAAWVAWDCLQAGEPVPVELLPAWEAAGMAMLEPVQLDARDLRADGACWPVPVSPEAAYAVVGRCALALCVEP